MSNVKIISNDFVPIKFPSCFRRGAQRAGWFFSILSFSGIALAVTNEVVSDYQKQLNEITTKYESQWDTLTKSADKVTATISASKQKQILLDKLMNRIENKNDPLDYLQKYESLITDSEITHLFYGTAYDMLHEGDNKRAGKLFDFLINEKNPNGFAVAAVILARYFA